METHMYKHILIATDGSELASKAIEQGFALAKSLDAKATVVTVTADWSPTQMAERAEFGAPHPVEDYEGRVAAHATSILAACINAAKSAGVKCTPVHVKDRAAADGIIETAKSSGCDLIIMASHGRSGVSRMLLGSIAAKVLSFATIPVLIYR